MKFILLSVQLCLTEASFSYFQTKKSNICLEDLGHLTGKRTIYTYVKMKK